MLIWNPNRAAFSFVTRRRQLEFDQFGLQSIAETR